MIVVSDTSPLSSLYLIGQLSLLPAVFGKIIVPKTVMKELAVLETGFGHDLSALKTAPWLEVRAAEDVKEVARLARFIDAGESDAIVLAKELHAEYLLIDDKHGREAAIAEGLKTIGVIGVFMLAKKAGLIAAVRPHLDDLKSKAKFRIHEKLYWQVLLEMGE
jgi:uncharacterized protein